MSCGYTAFDILATFVSTTRCWGQKDNYAWRSLYAHLWIKLKWGTSQDEPILLDSDMGDIGVLDDIEKEILVDLSDSQAALSDATIQTTTTKVNDVLLLGSQDMSKLKTESISSLGSVQETIAISEWRLKRLRWAKSTESSALTSPSNVKEASLAMANSSDISTPETGATLFDSPLESHEIPIRGSLTLQTFQSGIVYWLKFSQEELPFSLEIEHAQDVISSASSGDRDRERLPLREQVVSRPSRYSIYSEDDDELLIWLKEKDKLPWDKIAEHFPERTKGTLQVHYSTKLKNCSQMSKYKKRKITNSAKESGEIYPSRFSMDLLDPQLQDVPSSTSILLATADSTGDAHRSILSITPGNIESTEVQPLCNSQGGESNLVAINATEGR
ncbi:hypothetical protein O988_01734 [Pseudogymnoascus sp. VKM F-3808]|nr:hypothetical protein O988_01734 [Pseudogymnoascus sp. VKM F-3808]